ncbi:MAG: ABC transporter substrate-binding protein [Microbacteriaceae bacterium]|nr:ABC transporter substrate-binding protein [Microbacteriaceae bacterium]
MSKKHNKRKLTGVVALSTSIVFLATACAGGATDDGDADSGSSDGGSTVDATGETKIERAEQWLDEEFDNTTLSREEALAEMQWFIDAAEEFDGMEISVVSETIAPHEYESNVLTQAFEDITGIKVTHDLIGEGDVIERLQTEIQTRNSIYDGYVNDSDLIGTHQRGDYVFPIDDFDSAYVSPTLDLDDFIGIDFTTGADDVLYQLPDQQFANLYWFRYDWFNDEDIKQQFEDEYGYELGVPVNWTAYEQIADFFTNKVNGDGTIDGEEVFGHMDYGKKDPSLGWRFTDAWLSMAGNGDTIKGTPNGLPVDEWGIRVEGCKPAGSSVSRGGDVNGPASVYALQKYLDWFEYAPPTAQGMDFSESGPVVGQGQIAQQIFWYTVFTASASDPSLPVNDEDGNPKWRMAPSPHGAYWEDGKKLGYQDVGSWTFMNHADEDKRNAAWLYAQFVTSKTVDVDKSIAGLTFIRDSTVNADYFTENANRYGGLIEFYRSPDRVNWTPTGTNVPDYPALAQLWWANVGQAAAGEATAQEAMDSLAEAQDEVMARLERSGSGGECGVELNEERDPQYWYDQPGAPVPALANEDETPETVPYDDLVSRWQAAG